MEICTLDFTTLPVDTPILSISDDLFGLVFSPVYLTPVELTAALRVCKKIHKPAISHALSPKKACVQAAADGNLVLLKLFAADSLISPDKCAEAAASAGHIHVLDWLDANYPLDYNVAMVAAVDFGRITVLDWTYTRGADPSRADVAATAGYCGQLPVLQWLYDHGEWVIEGIDGAVGGGYIHILEWYETIGSPFSDQYIIKAAQVGILPVVKFAHDHMYNIPSAAVKQAAEWCRTEILEYFVSIGIHMTADVFAVLMTSFHDTDKVIAQLEWLHSIGCPYDAQSAKMARIEVLLWLRENRYPLSEIVHGRLDEYDTTDTDIVMG